MISILAAGCGSAALPRPSGPEASPRDAVTASTVGAEDAEKPVGDGTVAVYGALTGVGLGLGALGVYGLTRGEGPNERTGSRPELWLGVQGVVAGAALAVPFGALTVSSLASRDAGEDQASEAEPRRVREPAEAQRPRRGGVEARPVVGLGSIGVTGEF